MWRVNCKHQGNNMTTKICFFLSNQGGIYFDLRHAYYLCTFIGNGKSKAAHNNSCKHRTFSDCAKHMKWRLLLLLFSFKDKHKYIGIVPTHSRTVWWCVLCMCCHVKLRFIYSRLRRRASKVFFFFFFYSVFHFDMRMMEDMYYRRKIHAHTQEINSQITYTHNTRTENWRGNTTWIVAASSTRFIHLKKQRKTFVFHDSYEIPIRQRCLEKSFRKFYKNRQVWYMMRASLIP